jgi:hypothetical protein
MSYKGRFKPRNPEKYRGNADNIIYRSLWELKLMRYLDLHSDILEWASEEFHIPYISPVDKRPHRYFPDFWLRKKNPEGVVETFVIEVKPAKESKLPVFTEGKKITQGQKRDIIAYAVNQAKWKAAEEFCADRKWQFKVFTEKELGIK